MTETQAERERIAIWIDRNRESWAANGAIPKAVQSELARIAHCIRKGLHAEIVLEPREITQFRWAMPDCDTEEMPL